MLTQGRVTIFDRPTTSPKMHLSSLVIVFIFSGFLQFPTFPERVTFRSDDICITSRLSCNGQIFISPREHLDALVSCLTKMSLHGMGIFGDEVPHLLSALGIKVSLYHVCSQMH